MRRIASFLLTFMALGLAAEGSAATELTLDDCIEIALKNRAAIIRARGADRQAGADRLAALGEFLPTIRASYSYNKGKDWDIFPPNEVTEYYVAGLDTIVLVTDGDTATAIDARYGSTITGYVDPPDQDKGPSKNWNLSADLALVNVPSWFNYAGASAATARARLDVLASEQDLIYAVKIVYYAFLASVENVSVQQEAVKRAEEQLKLIQSRFDLGSASKSDVLKQKVQYGNDQLAYLKADNAVIQAKAALAYTIGIDPRQDHQFSSEYRVREYEGTLDDAVTFGLDHNPALLASQKTADQAKHSLRAAKALYLPTLSLFADYSKFNGTVSYPYSQDYGSKSRTYGFAVSWNLFDGFSRERQVTSAGVFRNNTLADLADARNLTVRNVKTSYLEIQQLKKQVEVSKENVAAAEEDMKITQEKYNLGAATILDLLDAQVSLKEAQTALIRAEFDLNLSIAKLENAMGKM